MDYYTINQVLLIGWVATVPKVRVTRESPAGRGGKKLARFQLATKEVYAKGARPKTFFHHCHAWGARADFVEKYVVPGSYISITGRLNYFLTKGEEKTRRLDFVMVDKIGFLPGGHDDSMIRPDFPERAGEGESLPEGEEDPIDKGNPFP